MTRENSFSWNLMSSSLVCRTTKTQEIKLRRMWREIKLSGNLIGKSGLPTAQMFQRSNQPDRHATFSNLDSPRPMQSGIRVPHSVASPLIADSGQSYKSFTVDKQFNWPQSRQAPKLANLNQLPFDPMKPTSLLQQRWTQSQARFCGRKWKLAAIHEAESDRLTN